MAEFNLHHILLLVASLISFDIIIAEEWTQEYNSLYYTVVYMPDTMEPNGTLVANVITSLSGTSCSYFCTRLGSVSHYYNNADNMCYCNNDFDTRLTMDNQTDIASSEIMYGYITSKVHASHNHSARKFDIHPYKMNCFELYHHGYVENAIFVLQPIRGGNIIELFCDMDNVLDVGADDCLQWLQHGYLQDGVYKIRLPNEETVNVWCDQTGGGWTVFQRREDGSVGFYRNWTEYVNGFGNISGEYWLGLEAIHLLTKQPSTLRIDMEAFKGTKPVNAYALYDKFTLQPSSDKYRLSYGTFTGDCGDGLSSQKNQKFTTFDQDNDNDIRKENCAVLYRGGWWYNKCHSSNLNGIYYGEFENVYPARGITWYYCWGNKRSMKKCSMKIKRI